MDLSDFDRLTRKDFENGAVLDEIRSVFKEREDMAEILHESLAVLKGLVLSTTALLIGLHDVLDISLDDDDFPVAIRKALEQANFAIAKAENHKAQFDIH